MVAFINIFYLDIALYGKCIMFRFVNICLYSKTLKNR